MIPCRMNPMGIVEHWPLTLQALENSTVKMTVSAGSPTASGLKYRKLAQPWTAYSIDTDISLAAGEWVQFKNSAGTLNSSGNTVKFVLSGKLAAFGDLMSMLNADACVSYCFSSLFSSNNALYSAKDLRCPVNLATCCLQSAFAWCQYLAEGPATLPARTLASSCYSYMFQGNTRLRKMPRIQATQYPGWCCQYMYHYCGSALTGGMETVPILATTLGTSSLQNMFNSAKISRLEVNFTDWNTAGNSTANWVSGVPGSGTFVKPSALSPDTGDSKIPSGWTVVNK